MSKLTEYLRDKKDSIVKIVRTRIVREKPDYSEHTTWWYTTISYDELTVIDFDKLMEEIEAFEESFKK